MLLEVNDSLYPKKEYSKLNFFINALIALIIIVLVFEISFSISNSGIYVIGTSMEDTLIGATEHAEGDAYYIDGKLYKNYIADTQGDYVYVNKNIKPDYGKIVVAIKDDGTTIIKRVIAKGGDYVKIDCGKVYVRHSAEESFGEPLDEPYLTSEKNKPSAPNNTFYNDDVGFYVDEGCYFLLGDHRDVSLDSREGNGICFTEKQIYGVVTDWSKGKRKSFYTALHKFFTFDLPDFFGIDNRVKSTKEVK